MIEECNTNELTQIGEPFGDHEQGVQTIASSDRGKHVAFASEKEVVV